MHVCDSDAMNYFRHFVIIVMLVMRILTIVVEDSYLASSVNDTSSGCNELSQIGNWHCYSQFPVYGVYSCDFTVFVHPMDNDLIGIVLRPGVSACNHGYYSDVLEPYSG